jgi:hypothetical protein
MRSVGEFKKPGERMMLQEARLLYMDVSSCLGLEPSNPRARTPVPALASNRPVVSGGEAGPGGRCLFDSSDRSVQTGLAPIPRKNEGE